MPMKSCAGHEQKRAGRGESAHLRTAVRRRRVEAALPRIECRDARKDPRCEEEHCLNAKVSSKKVGTQWTTDLPDVVVLARNVEGDAGKLASVRGIKVVGSKEGGRPERREWRLLCRRCTWCTREEAAARHLSAMLLEM